MREISGALIAIGLVLVAVFVPAALISGIPGIFYRQFAVTISVATALSCFCSLTLSPALATLILRHATVRPVPHRPGPARMLRWFLARFNRDETHPLSGKLEAECEVLRVHDAPIVGARGISAGHTINLGKMALIRVGGIRVVLISIRQQAKDTAMFETLGVDWKDVRSLVVKSRGHFRAAFDLLFPDERIVEVDPPDKKVARDPDIVDAATSVLKIHGDNKCGRGVEGTGFLYAPNRLMTNAHVVAGTDDVSIEITPTRTRSWTNTLLRREAEAELGASYGTAWRDDD